MSIVKVNWTRAMLDRFKEAYGEAVRDREPDFLFDGHAFAPAYAKHLIAYLDATLEKS